MTLQEELEDACKRIFASWGPSIAPIDKPALSADIDDNVCGSIDPLIITIQDDGAVHIYIQNGLKPAEVTLRYDDAAESWALV